MKEEIAPSVELSNQDIVKVAELFSLLIKIDQRNKKKAKEAEGNESDKRNSDCIN